MPNLPWTARPDVSPAEDPSLAALLAGRGLPADAGAELRPVADVLAALTARPAGGELAGLAGAAAEFRRHAGRPAPARRPACWRLGGLGARLGVRVGAAAAVVAVGLGGAAAAAYAGVLPGSWQQFAHATIGAPAHPAGHDTPARTATDGPKADLTRSRHPAHHPHSSTRPGRHRSRHHGAPPPHVGPPPHAKTKHHAGSAHHAESPARLPFADRGQPPGVSHAHKALNRHAGRR